MSTERVGQERPGHFWAMWCSILLISALLRFSYPDWDQGIAAHPDERFLLGVAFDTPVYGNPCVVSPAFPYGHLPVTLISLIVQLSPQADPLYSSRLLSGAGGVLLVALTGQCGFRLSRSQTGGLLAALLAAFCPFFIQQAHFYTVDPWVAIIGTLALLLAMREKWLWSGACVGLAVACKASSMWIGVSLCIAMMVVTPNYRWMRNGSWFLSGILAGMFIGAPWLILTPLQCWQGPLLQAQLATGRFIFPYTQQYARTIPWVYPLMQMFLWSMGPPVTIAGALTLLRSILAWRRHRRSYKLVLVVTALFFVATAGLYVKYPRYLLFIYPMWIAFATRGLLGVFHISCGNFGDIGRLGGVLITVLLTGFMGIAQASIYKGTHPWVEASRWIYENVVKGSQVVVESWDHPLPVPLSSGKPSNYQQVTVHILDEIRASSVDGSMLETLQEAQVVGLASRRNYGVVLQQPERFDVAYRWYEELFRNRIVHVFTRCPKIGKLALSDDPLQGLGSRRSPSVGTYCDAKWVLRLPRIDESFRVYEAPVTVILVRTD